MDREARDPPALRKLKELEKKLLKDIEGISNQLSKVKTQLQTKKRDKKDLEAQSIITKKSYDKLSKAPIVSLPEYWNLRVIIPAHHKALKKLREEIKQKEAEGKGLTLKKRELEKELEETHRAIATWNKVIKFKRKNQ